MTNLSNQEVAQLLLQRYSFLYEDTDNPDRTRPYRSSFFLQLPASTHLSAIVDYVNVPALNTEELASGGMMHGILVACTIAVRFYLFISEIYHHLIII